MPLIAFDLDGTLVDSQQDLAESANELLESLGASPLSIESITGMVGDGARALVRRVLKAAARDPAESSIYFGSIPADDHVPGFAELNRLALLEASIRPLLWIGNASFVSCHCDTFDNLACVVAGRRRFTLYRPEAIENLYVGPIDFTMAGPKSPGNG